MKVLGGILGAIAAPIILVLMVAAVYPRTSGENWDYATPLLTMVAAAGAVVVGAVAGARIAQALESGNGREAAVLAGGALGLIALFPAWYAWLIYVPRKPNPAKGSQRAEWVKEKNAFYAQHGFSEQPGLSLAWTLRSAKRGGSFIGMEWREYARGEDSIAAGGLGYKIGDDGWRWDYGADDRGRIVVFLDPRLERDGPVFEVVDRDIYRRETRDSPAFSTDSSLAARFAIPECIARFARAARENGSWDGRPDTLPVVVAERWTTPEGCPTIAVYQRPEPPSQSWEFDARGEPLRGGRFEIRPDSTSETTPFRFRFMDGGRGFLREASGAWHMRIGGHALLSDPAPPRCLMDLSVPCED